MGDIVGDFLEAPHQGLDPVQHLVQIMRQAIEFIAAACDRNSARKIAAHDGAGGFGHCIDAAQDPTRDEETADQSEHDHRRR